ncbi:hypothetical protein [Tahibacter aquaticus]|uniref:hypothetical protein n=1 Tax=Tahibacter aquaticus TaxID=520092 RepID=UPI0010618EEA|nr:hypothetical protein [Tahibacter aquaticus]
MKIGKGVVTDVASAITATRSRQPEYLSSKLANTASDLIWTAKRLKFRAKKTLAEIGEGLIGVTIT